MSVATAALLLHGSGLAAISVSVVAPKSGSTQSGTIPVQVNVTSTYDLTTVHAQVESVGVDLTAGATWSGTLSLTALARGAKVLTVTATDVFGSTGTSTVSFTKDDPPVITLSSPRAFSVARPVVRVTATCTDDDATTGCIGFKAAPTYSACDPFCSDLATGVATIDTDVDLTKYDGSTFDLELSARDSADRSTSVIRKVHVEASTHLVDIATLGALVLDVDDTRILYIDVDGTVKIHRRVDGAETTIGSAVLQSATGQLARGWLTSAGAAFTSMGAPSDGPCDVGELDLWRGTGTATVLVPASCGIAGLFSLDVKGDFAVNSGQLMDLTTGTISPPIAWPRPTGPLATGGLVGQALASNGDLIGCIEDPSDYPPGHIAWWRYRAGTLAQIGTTAFVGGRRVVADGNELVYDKRIDPVGAVATAMQYGDGIEIDLSGALTGSLGIGTTMAASGEWVAFLRPSPASGVSQVWSRSPLGVEQQLTPFGSHSAIDALSRFGDVSLFNGLGSTRRYIGVPAGLPLEVGSTLGRAKFLSDGLYVVLGRSVLRYPKTIGGGDAGTGDAGADAIADVAALDAADDSSTLIDAVPPDGFVADSIERDAGPTGTSPDAAIDTFDEGADGGSGGDHGGGCSVSTPRFARRGTGVLAIGVAAVLLARRRRTKRGASLPRSP